MILIDVDGTLVDSVPDLAYCVDEMMKALGRPPHGEAKVRNWVGNGVERLVRRALVGQLEGEPSDADFEQAYPIFIELYRDNTSKRSLLYPGIRDGLDALKAAGFRLGCVTNKAAQFTEPLLKDLGRLRRLRDRDLGRYPAAEEARSGAPAACGALFRRGAGRRADGRRLGQRREGVACGRLSDRVHELRLQPRAGYPRFPSGCRHRCADGAAAAAARAWRPGTQPPPSVDWDYFRFRKIWSRLSPDWRKRDDQLFEARKLHGFRSRWSTHQCVVEGLQKIFVEKEDMVR